MHFGITIFNMDIAHWFEQLKIQDVKFKEKFKKHQYIYFSNSTIRQCYITIM